MSQRIDVRKLSSEEEMIQQAVESLRSGNLLVLPTETVYGLCALASNEKAVLRLLDTKGRSANRPVAIAISGRDMLEEFVEQLDPLQDRLTRRCWPGPVTLVMPGDFKRSCFGRMSSLVQQAVMPEKRIGFRVPQHPLTLAILRELEEPVVLSSANLSGTGESVNMEEIIADFGEEVDLYLDDGPVQGHQPSTVLLVENGQYKVLREGEVSRVAIERLTAKIIVFVCTGNTCRSPIAEVICRGLLAEQQGCSVEELEEQGYVVMSAGVAASGSSPASRTAEEVAAQRGFSLSDHQSQMINERLIRFADKIYTMTRGHREVILSNWPSADTRLSVLRVDGGDIADPFGGSLADYEVCAEQIEAELRKRLAEIML